LSVWPFSFKQRRSAPRRLSPPAPRIQGGIGYILHITSIIRPMRVLIFSRNFLVDSERCVLLCATHVEYIFIFQKQHILYFASHSIGRNT
jgi:hypothetical protein